MITCFRSHGLVSSHSNYSSARKTSDSIQNSYSAKKTSGSDISFSSTKQSGYGQKTKNNSIISSTKLASVGRKEILSPTSSFSASRGRSYSISPGRSSSISPGRTYQPTSGRSYSGNSSSVTTRKKSTDQRKSASPVKISLATLK